MLASEPVSDLAKKQIVGEVSGFIAEAFEQFEPDPNLKMRGRPRVLPSLCLWGAMLLCLIDGATSQLAVWRIIHHYGVFLYPPIHITDQAVYKRFETEGEAPLIRLFAHIRQLLAQRLDPWLNQRPQQTDLAPFATQIYSYDEMTLDQIKATLPPLRDVPKGDDQRIPGKIAALFDTRRQQWCKIQFLEDFRQNCKVIAQEFVQDLAAGTLLLCDLGYFAFEWFDWLTDQQYFYVSRLKQKITYEVIHPLYSDRNGVFDAIVWMGKYRSDRAAHAVRLVHIPYGGTLHTYITNVLDPQQLSVAAIAQLYARRWDIESAFRLLKQYLKLHVLWSAKSVIVKQQLWGCLILSSILYALRWEIALRADVDLFDVSMPLMIQYLPRYFAHPKQGIDPIDAFIADGRSAGFIRPSRRIKIVLPPLNEPYYPAPPDLVLKRTPRYAHKD